jgi:arsenite-transporting ATPase
MSAPQFSSQPDLQLIFFGGKGGVGKTSCAAATALHLAREASRAVMLVSTDPAHSLLDILGEPTPELERVQVVEFAPGESLEEFRRKHGAQLREIAERGTFLDREDIDRFLSLSLPGMDELFALLEISRWVEERGRDRTIVVDTAPTGHTLRLLEMPQLLRRWVDALNALLAKHRYMKQVFGRGGYQPGELDRFLDDLSTSIVRAEAQLRDGRRTRFVPVMIAEEMAIRETRKLLDELDGLGIAAPEIVVNKLAPASACVCDAARIAELKLLARLPAQFAGRRLLAVPYYAEEVRGLDRLRHFWDGVHDLRREEASGEVRGAPAMPRVQRPARLPGPALRLLMFAGKGGVGKTTLACATAVRLAREWPGEEILLFSTDPAHSLGDCLDVAVGPRPVRVMRGLTALEIDAEAELEQLKQSYRREVDELLSSMLQNLDLTFDRPVMERMLDLSPPGLDEIMALTSAMQFMADGKYQRLILDSAPTGHLIRLLELPEIIDTWLKAFFELLLKYRDVFRPTGLADRLIATSKELKRFRRTLVDARLTSLYAVSILTEVALAETEDLLSTCERLRIAVPALFLNMATPAESTSCASCVQRAQQEARVRERFARAAATKHQTVVYRQSEPRGLVALERLGGALYAAVS